ncbi:MAG: DMT family transporter, partial [Alphaproteobacteria bacterium]
ARCSGGLSPAGRDGEGRVTISFKQASPVTPPADPRSTDSGLGIAYMAAGMFLFSAVDTQAKFLTDTLPPIQIAWSRQLGLLVGVVFLLAFQGFAVLRTRYPVLQIMRGAAAAGSATLFIVAVSFVPLADAVAVAFLAPFIVTVLSALILREPIGVRRWTAVVIGFVGAMIVIRPGLGVIHPAVMLVALAAVLFALRQILSRVLSASDRTATTVAYTALAGSLVLTVPLPFVWQWPTTTLEVVLLVNIAVLSAVAELMVIRALEVARAVVVAPVQYTLLIWGTMYGYLVFAELPDLWTWVGALIIIATGAYTLHRERLAGRRR